MGRAGSGLTSRFTWRLSRQIVHSAFILHLSGGIGTSLLAQYTDVGTEVGGFFIGIEVLDRGWGLFYTIYSLSGCVCLYQRARGKESWKECMQDAR